ncbi:MAG: SH3 domain-containing protein [Eubacteriales bacterium]|nr:SH3 domain-containing protein [Eubacteriales bacterium]
MLRAILTSHISQEDLNVLSLQLNGALIGQADAAKASNRVISGNREIHLAAGFYASTGDRSERRYIQEQNRLFQLLFADLQTQGLAALPDLAHKHFPEAAFLLIASAEMVLVWQDAKKGVYLLRNKQLFRLQPTLRPHGLWSEAWMTYGDFYAFVPQEEDLLIFLSPEFVDRFKPEQLEEIFSSKQQLFSMMSELNRLGKTYGFNFDQTWLALQFQRLELNRIYKGHANEFLSEEVRRIARTEAFSRAVPRSKVSRVLHGQELIPVKDAQPRLRPARLGPQAPNPAQPNRPHLGDWQRKRQEAARINLINEEDRQKRQATLATYAQRRDPLDNYFEKVREFSFAPLKAKLGKLLRRFFNLWPAQPLLSKFFAGSSLLLLVLILALGVQGVSRSRRQASVAVETEATLLTEVPDRSAIAQAPLETNLEVQQLVTVNNLQIRQAKDPASALIASVKRGEVVVQLAPEEEGWVYVRADQGVEGYVYASYLFSRESETSK